MFIISVVVSRPASVMNFTHFNSELPSVNMKLFQSCLPVMIIVSDVVDLRYWHAVVDVQRLRGLSLFSYNEFCA